MMVLGTYAGSRGSKILSADVVKNTWAKKEPLLLSDAEAVMFKARDLLPPLKKKLPMLLLISGLVVVVVAAAVVVFLVVDEDEEVVELLSSFSQPKKMLGTSHAKDAASRAYSKMYSSVKNTFKCK